MVAKVEVRRIEIAVRLDHQDLILAVKLAQLLTPTVVVEAQHIPIEPDHPTAQRGRATLFERNLMYLCLGQDIAHRATPLDGDLAKVFLENQQLLPGLRLQDHLHRLRLAIRIGAEIKNA